MMKNMLTILFLLGGMLSAFSQSTFEEDQIKTGKGDVKITFVGHGSLIFTFGGKNIFVDPYGKLADYSQFPKADLILITHEHPDHLDAAAIGKIKKEGTEIIVNGGSYDILKSGVVMKNSETKTVCGFQIEAVPAYNIVNKRDAGIPYHAKGAGNGYVITFGDKRFYVAGDTENIPEMKSLKNITCAFLPMNLPYTMTPEMTAEAAKMIMPRILYPYHFGDTDTAKIVDLLRKEKAIEVRIRKMK